MPERTPLWQHTQLVLVTVKVGGITEPRAAIRSQLLSGEEKLVINQRRSAIHCPPHFGPATACIEGACPGLGVEGIQADCVGGPSPGDVLGLLQTPSADTPALLLGSRWSAVGKALNSPRQPFPDAPDGLIQHIILLVSLSFTLPALFIELGVRAVQD